MFEMQVRCLGGGKILDSGGGRSLRSKSKMLGNPAFCLVATCFQPSLWKNVQHSASILQPFSALIQVTHGQLLPHADKAHLNALTQRNLKAAGGVMVGGGGR